MNQTNEITNEVQIQCPHCESVYNCPLELVGDKGYCAGCKKYFEIEEVNRPRRRRGIGERVIAGAIGLFGQ